MSLQIVIKNSQPAIVGFSKHNHRQCMKSALRQAEHYCQQNSLRFTKVRKRALGILLESHTALGAYELLSRLSDEGLGSKPPVAYRALNFLLTHGFIHRVEKLNAFVACAYPGANHQPAFLICNGCGSVAEAKVAVTEARLASAAEQSGFQISHAILEADGQCPECQ